MTNADTPGVAPVRPGTAPLSRVHPVRDPAPGGDARPPTLLLHGVRGNEDAMAALGPMLDA